MIIKNDFLVKKMALKSFNIEEPDWIQFGKNLPSGVSRSEKIREWITQYNNYTEGKVSHIDKAMLQGKINTLTEKLSEERLKLESYKRQLSEIEKKDKEEEEKRLQKEKEAIESAKRCYECKEVKSDDIRMHRFGNIQVCHSCFMSRGGQKVKEWINIGNSKKTEGN